MLVRSAFNWNVLKANHYTPKSLPLNNTHKPGQSYLQGCRGKFHHIWILIPITPRPANLALWRVLVLQSSHPCIPKIISCGLKMPTQIDHDQQPAAAQSRSRKQHTRSRTGCLTCRKRHRRCDERRPVWSVPHLSSSGRIDAITHTFSVRPNKPG